MAVMVWINPAAAWESAVDAVAGMAFEEIVLLLVTEGGGAAAPDTLTGLLGPAGHEPGEAFAGVEEEQAAALFDEAEARMGRPVRRLWERGVPEHEVVTAASGADLLVCVRDGAPGLPGPDSLGPATRFVVDHAPCGVLLVWPGDRSPRGKG
ncbi:universal stress protein [Actinoallomurus sp. CA-142502]|uniref:universal stress protein n=1 Tax=Actinoallomurus sp. CA-142502 TaxID=3239885 RepID=UPI003D908F09